MKRAHKAFFLIMSIFLALLSRHTSAEENEQSIASSSCHALDVIFLIDQSSSMSGYAGAPATDPTTQRRYAVEAAVDLLADIALDLCPDVIHRIAVVSYGSEAEIDLTLSEINPSTSEDAKNIRETLKKHVVADNLGQTNPKSAFDLAAQILEDAAPIGDEIRKRVVIFITDGIPCVGPECIELRFDINKYGREMVEQVAGDFSFDETLLQQEQCLKDLREELGPEEALPAEKVNACLEEYHVGPDAYKESTYIWTILLSFGGDYTERLLRLYEDMSASHAGEVIFLSENRQDIPSTFRNILEQLTGVKAARLNCGSFAVNPYLDKARLVFYKFDESVVVSLSYSDVDGNVHEISNGQGDDSFKVDEYYRDGPNERYVISRPYPGIWTLASENCDGLDAFYDPISINSRGYQPNIPAEIAQRDRLPYYDVEQPYYLEYEMKDEAGSNISQAEHSQFAIDIQMKVSEPGGTLIDYRMEWDKVNKLFKATEPFHVATVGTYHITITGTTFKHEGEPSPVGNVYSQVFNTPYELFHQEAEFIVFPVSPFSIEILAPSDGEELKPIHGQLSPEVLPEILPITVRARIIDRQGESSLDPDKVFINPDRTLEVYLSSDSNMATALLTRYPENQDEFIGEITDFDTEGEIQATVKLVGDFNVEFYPDNRSDQVVFERADEIWNFEITTPIDGSELKPIHGTIVDGWPLTIQPISIHARVVDQEGNVYSDSDGLLNYAPTILTATLSSGERSVSVSLLSDPAIPGEYSGQVVDLDTRGEHTLRVGLGLDYPGYYSPGSRPARIDFYRSDFLFTTPFTYYAILLLIILFFLWRIIRYFAIRTNPVTGTLVFEDAGETIVEFGLNSGKNWIDISPRTLNRYPQLDIKRLKIENVAKSKRSRKKGEEELFISDAYTGDSINDVGVVAHVVAFGRQRQSVNLTPGLPTLYGDSLFQMIYKPEG